MWVWKWGHGSPWVLAADSVMSGDARGLCHMQSPCMTCTLVHSPRPRWGRHGLCKHVTGGQETHMSSRSSVGDGRECQMSSSLEPYLDLLHAHTLHAHAHIHTDNATGLQAHTYTGTHGLVQADIHPYIDTLIHAHLQARTGMHICRHIMHAHRHLYTCPLSQAPTFILSCAHTQTHWFRPVPW